MNRGVPIPTPAPRLHTVPWGISRLRCDEFLGFSTGQGSVSSPAGTQP